MSLSRYWRDRKNARPPRASGAAFSYFKKGRTMATAGVFVDGEYLRKMCMEEFADIFVDLRILGPKLCEKIDVSIELLRTYYYDSMPHKSKNPDKAELELHEKKRAMFEAFSYFDDFEVRKGRCIKVFDNEGNPRFLQKGIDTKLSIDLTRLSATGKIEHAILLAGDGDFVPPIRAAKEEGVKIWLFHGASRSRELFKEADRRIRITRDLLSDIKR